MDDAAIRLKCLEIANAEHPGTRLMRAKELYEWVRSSAPPAAGSESSGGPSVSSDVQIVREVAGFKITSEHLARLDENEVNRTNES